MSFVATSYATAAICSLNFGRCSCRLFASAQRDADHPFRVQLRLLGDRSIAELQWRDEDARQERARIAFLRFDAPAIRQHLGET
ncbi:MAG TPA: hypothetical protein VGR95_04670 [Thermoanaerobaculia bacterium]|nr:hypothetical protein [Thermoanaerobaculia bacterium]